jgi:dimethylhistidine N-methyltransferase
LPQRFEHERDWDEGVFAIPRPPRWSPASSITRDALAGLTAVQKSLPCKYFYDRRGSALFEKICATDEYYVTRAETEILQDAATEIGALCGPGSSLIDLGGCDSAKARILLDAMDAPVAYVPVDVSREALTESAVRCRRDYPDLTVIPLIADFTRLQDLPRPRRGTTLVLFAGSTIGNFEPAEAASLLARVAARAGPAGALLVGIDLRKPKHVLEAAYNDAAGWTAAFNLNLLERLNREADADFDFSTFKHVAFFDEEKSRIEMHLESLLDQTVTVAGTEIPFAAGERIHTESSHKYTDQEFVAICTRAGIASLRHWTDAKGRFSVHYCRC